MLNPKRQRRIENRHTKEDQTAQDIGLTNALRSFEGRRFLWGLLAETGVFHNPYRSDPYDTAFQCGAMNLGQSLFSRILSLDPTAFTKMQDENQALIQRLEEKLSEAEKETDYDSDE